MPLLENIQVYIFFSILNFDFNSGLDRTTMLNCILLITPIEIMVLLIRKIFLNMTKS